MTSVLDWTEGLLLVHLQVQLMNIAFLFDFTEGPGLLHLGVQLITLSSCFSEGPGLLHLRLHHIDLTVAIPRDILILDHSIE